MAILSNRHGRRLLAGLCAVALLACVHAAPTPEYQLKAVFLFNFAQFVEWPAEAFPTADAPLVIGVLGSDPFEDYLEEIVRGEKVNNHPFVIQHYRRLEDIRQCHILFISPSMAPREDEILARLRGRSILTVGDVQGFATRGGMIRFVTDQGKIRLRVNIEATQAAGLTISSKLLRAAEVISPGKD